MGLFTCPQASKISGLPTDIASTTHIVFIIRCPYAASYVSLVYDVEVASNGAWIRRIDTAEWQHIG